MPNILDKNFKYTPSHLTDIRQRLTPNLSIKNNAFFHKTMIMALARKVITLDQMNQLIDIYNSENHLD